MKKEMLRWLAFSFGYLILQACFYFLGKTDAALSHRAPLASSGFLLLFCAATLLFVHLRKNGKSASDAILSPRKTTARTRAAIISACMPLTCYAIFLILNIRLLGFLTFSDIVLLSLMAMTEECYFRLLGTHFFLKKGRSFFPRAVLLSLLFGASHIVGYISTDDMLSTLGQCAFAFTAGLFYLAVYQRSGRLLLPLLTHFCHNLVCELLMYQAASSSSALVGSLVLGLYYAIFGICILKAPAFRMRKAFIKNKKEKGSGLA